MVKQFLLWATLLLSPLYMLSTHIVGGELNYVYNGGSSYTIKLKLYKDCGTGTAGFPGSVTISVRGYNGAAFSPSKDITMNLGTVNSIPSNLAPCAVPPNPLPCVQEGIYTITVNNLPPVQGGYHLYYQLTARNLSLTNINGACNCIGESFYAYIPGIPVTAIWNEDFSLPNNTTVDNGSTSWTLTPGSTPPNSAFVNNNTFEITGSNNASATWSSQLINISSCSSVNISADLSENGSLDANDSIKIFYSLNGGSPIPFPTNGILNDDFTSAVASANGLSGSTLKIIIRTKFDGSSPNSEIYKFDNINISCVGNASPSNSNAVFNSFPPLFLCVNQPFSFNHSATDTDGDSLVYSLYTPYNGDNGTGPLDPTFNSNIASFTPVTYLPGYSTSNPLGSGPLSINASTGLITGVPLTIGQFVVGVMVKEYRNGVYLSQTLRDFQFNILNCPQPPTTLAVPNTTVNNGCSASLLASGITSTSATWTSINPGAPGTYNNFLSCTSGCLNNSVTASGTPPPFVDYVVCGNATNCAGNYICDTFRVTFNSALAVNIIPSNPVLCSGQTSTTLTAIGLGGTPPYSYLWNNVNPFQTINIGVGTYNVKLTDASGCPPVYKSVTVTTYSVPINANAGANQTKCIQNPLATINATVTGASGGIWSGGQGNFSPNNTTLTNLFYTPSAAELAAGSASLILTTTGNGDCPPDIDTVVISYFGFTGVVTTSTTPVSCFAGSNGSASVNIGGGTVPYTYLWNSVPSQTTATANNLSAGIYSVTISDGIGCTRQTTVSVSEPVMPLSTNFTITNVSCFGGNNGSITGNATGGTAPYTYTWSPGGQTSSSINSLTSGNYSVTVKDSRGCVVTNTFSVTQPNNITVVLSYTNISCFGGSNGIINSTITGGTSPYSYSWSPNGSTAPQLSGLAAGNYTLSVTDSKGCNKIGTVNLTQSPALTLTTSVTNETCNELNNGSATITVAGGNPGYTYLWLPGNINSQSITNRPSGSYSVSVTDSKGCTTATVLTINEPSALNVNFINQINVGCFNGNNGAVTANPSGGTPNYTYTWTPGGANTAGATGLTAGTYTVLIKDNNACLSSNTVAITQPTVISIAHSASATSCNGGNNGTISLNITGGTAPYSYFWLPGGQTSPVVTGLAAGNYTVNVMDNNSCPATKIISITQPTALSISSTPTNVSCFGGNNGAINASVSGGTPPYTYFWLPGGSTSQNNTNLSAGNYTLTVTDNMGCVKSKTVTLTQPNSMLAVTTVTNETCDYLNNGAAKVTVNGGSPGYTYLWLPGNQTTQTITNKASGTYTITITDSKGCITNTTAIINEPAMLTAGFINQTDVSCYNGNNGAVTVLPSGGTPNYTYTWSPGGANNASINSLTAGTYTVKIKDSKSCTTSNTVAIDQPQILDLVSTITNVNCNGSNNGAVSLSPTGGTPPYTHNLMPGNIIGANFTHLAPGTYSIITEDAKGCVDNTTITITQPIDISTVTSATNSNCSQQNGEASVSVTSGGTPPFTYNWLPYGGSASTATNLGAGSYSVVISDAGGCSSTKIILINDNEAPVVNIVSTTSVSCFGGNNGSITAAHSAGNGPTYTYSWSPSGGNSLIATNLTKGTYILTVTDASGCIGNAISPTIVEAAPISININTVSVSCFGGNNGSATATVIGGTPGYTYNWLPNAVSTPTFSNLSANNYSVQIKDVNNCVSSASFVISQPNAPLSIALTATDVTCFNGNNGSIAAIANGGTPPYLFNCMPGNISGQNIFNLSAGNYTFTATDINGCSATNTIAVNEPAPITLTTGVINSNCSLANGQASVNATGGTAPYIYSWLPSGGANPIENGLMAGTYTVTVNDANNCLAITTETVNDNPAPLVSVTSSTNVTCFGGSNGSAEATVVGGSAPFTYSWSPTGGNNAIASGLSIGFYSVTVTAANGCTATAEAPEITQPINIFINVTPTHVSCFGGNNGSATATVIGGTPGYTYNWLPNAVSTPTFSNLSANNYSLQIKDANNCIKSSTFAINQPTAALSMSITAVPVSCFGGNNGAATAQISGGTPFYNYNWLPSGQNGSSVSGLTSGTYTLNVFDNNNCFVTNTISISQPTLPLTATAISSNITCNGSANGSATVTPTGGTPGYAYLWQPAGSNSSTVINLGTGNHSVTIIDAKGCSTNTFVTITQPSPLTATLISNNPKCNLPNGNISAQVSGGTGPYTYLWSPGSYTTPIISGLAGGNYNLTITDSKNCNSTYSVSLTNIPGPSLTTVSNHSVSCHSGNNGSATIAINQGTAPFFINWLPYGGTAITGNALGAGNYTAVVTDALGCVSSVSTSIIEPDDVTINVVSITPVSCNGGQDGAVEVMASGGAGSYNYNWTPNGSGVYPNNLNAGTYTLTVSDLNQCNKSITVTIPEPPALSSTITGITNALCYNGTGSSTISVNGGNPPYNYNWSTTPAQTGNTLLNASAGSFTVNISDSKGCATINTVSISQPSQVITTIIQHDTICNGQQGTLVTGATGGAGNYYYSWQPNNIINSGTFTASPTSNQTYTVTAFDQNGCIGLEIYPTITVYNLSAANLDVFGTSPICPGQAIPVYGQVTGNTGPLTFSWNNGLGNTLGTHIVQPSNPTNYVLTVSSVCGISIKDSVEILFSQPPTVSIAADTTKTCNPGTINFSNISVSSNPNDPISSWQWTFGDGIQTSLMNPSHSYTNPGTYTVNLTVTTDGGCTNSTTNSPIIINVYPSPTASFHTNSFELDLPYDNLSCVNTSAGADSYSWDFGDGASTTIVNPTHQYETLGSFEVILSALTNYGCRDTATSTITTKADIVFPNAFTPNGDGESGGMYDISSLNNDIFFPYTSGVAKYKLQIFNRWGELIFETENIKQGWDGYYKGKLCEEGVYVWKAFVKLSDGKVFNKIGDVTLLR